ncbi:DNA recombinase [Clostridium sp. BSD9I1]|uniref:DNA recombinase n=1 Tax=Clostridium sp. BSD9I1 TaxID=2003589 RepID=UPI001FA8F6BD|nr:DNA recombinase [Clostridium sp. BSD9I1]
MQVQEELIRRSTGHAGIACNSRTVLEDLLKDVVVKAINDLLGEKDDFLQVLRNNIETVINEQDTSAVAEIEKKLEELQKQLLIRTNSKEDYNDIADEIYRLREEKYNALAEDAEKKAVGQRLMDMTAFLKEQPTLIDNCDEQLIRRLIGKIMVYGYKFVVEFKSGVEVEVEM